MQRTVNARPNLRLIVVLAVGGLQLFASQSCRRSEGLAPAVQTIDGSTVTDEVVVTRSLDELMNLMGAQIERRTAVLESLAEHPDRFSADDRITLADSAHEEAMIARELAFLLAESETSTPAFCEAFEREVQEVEVREMDAWRMLRRRASEEHAILQAVYGSDAAVPSTGAARGMTATLLGPGWGRFAAAHPPLENDMPPLESAGDLAAYCIDGGHSEELFDALR